MKTLQKIYNRNIKREWRVPSNSREGVFHRVIWRKDGEWDCSCLAGQYGNECDHIKQKKLKVGITNQLSLLKDENQ